MRRLAKANNPFTRRRMVVLRGRLFALWPDKSPMSIVEVQFEDEGAYTEDKVASVALEKSFQDSGEWCNYFSIVPVGGMAFVLGCRGESAGMLALLVDLFGDDPSPAADVSRASVRCTPLEVEIDGSRDYKLASEMAALPDGRVLLSHGGGSRFSVLTVDAEGRSVRGEDCDVDVSLGKDNARTCLQALPDGRVLTIGGCGFSGTEECYLISPGGGTADPVAEKTQDFPMSPWDVSSVGLFGHFVATFGGQAKGGDSSLMCIYDTGRGLWAKVAECGKWAQAGRYCGLHVTDTHLYILGSTSSRDVSAISLDALISSVAADGFREAMEQAQASARDPAAYTAAAACRARERAIRAQVDALLPQARALAEAGGEIVIMRDAEYAHLTEGIRALLAVIRGPECESPQPAPDLASLVGALGKAAGDPGQNLPREDPRMAGGVRCTASSRLLAAIPSQSEWDPTLPSLASVAAAELLQTCPPPCRREYRGLLAPVLPLDFTCAVALAAQTGAHGIMRLQAVKAAAGSPGVLLDRPSAAAAALRLGRAVRVQWKVARSERTRRWTAARDRATQLVAANVFALRGLPPVCRALDDVAEACDPLSAEACDELVHGGRRRAQIHSRLLGLLESADYAQAAAANASVPAGQGRVP